MDIAACCRDMDIDPLDLLFPERMTPKGIEFYQAHGLMNMTIEEILKDAEVLDNGMIKIHHTCVLLTPEGRCSIYASRPEICREFDCNRRTDCTCKGTGKCGT